VTFKGHGKLLAEPRRGAALTLHEFREWTYAAPWRGRPIGRMTGEYARRLDVSLAVSCSQTEDSNRHCAPPRQGAK
jgi:hypothetical protein